MSDRSEELRRQRDLLREHLAFIERELAAEEGRAPEVTTAGHPPPIQTLEPVDDRDAEAILAEYRKPETSIAMQTKVGCVVYFIVALGLIALAVAAIYMLSRASRAH